MRETRRQMLTTLAGAAAVMLTTRPSLAAQKTPTPQPLPSPNAPGNQNVPAGMDGPDLIRQGKQSTVSPLVWTEIKTDAQKLMEMTSDFKSHVEQTNLSSTLPLGLLKEAHQIEKLAKHIQDRMRS